MGSPVDVFISHAFEDRALCSEFEKHLSALVREGVIRAWSRGQIAPGEDERVQIERHLSAAPVVILLVSADYFASNQHHDHELIPAIERAQAGSVRVIPVLVRPFDRGASALEGLKVLPDNGRAVTKWPNRDDAWVSIVGAIRSTLRRELDRAPGPAELRASGMPVTDAGPRSPTPHNLPPRRLFIGRTKEILDLGEALRRDERFSITQASLWGLGGVGKTALALAYAHDALEQGLYPGGIWWVVAEGRPIDAMLRLAATLHQHAPGLVAGVRPDASADELAEAARRALEAVEEPSLLVLDNVSEAGLEELLPGGKAHVLVTTRDRQLTVGAAVALEELTVDDALALATRLAQRAAASEPEKAALLRVVDSLGRLAVAVEVAARAVFNWAKTWMAYEQALTRQLDEAFDAPTDRSQHYKDGAFAALDLSIGRCDTGARRLLEGAAVFAPDGVPLAWMCAAAEMDPDSVQAKRTLGELEGLGLVKEDPEARAVSMHRLVHRRVRVRAERERWREYGARAASYLASWMNEHVGPARKQMERVDALMPHIEAVQSVGPASAQATILDRVATHLQIRAQYAEARKLTERALGIVEATFGTEHPYVVVILSNLATVLNDLGESADAKLLVQRALSIAEATFAPDHPNVAASLSNLATVIQDLGDSVIAKPLMERALDISEAILGPDHPTVATCLSNLAMVLKDLGEAARALPLLERALRIDEAAFGPDHHDVAISLSNLAVVLQDLGEAARAQPLLERALAIEEGAFGPDHPGVATVLSNLGLVLQSLGNAAGAQPLHERALAIIETTFGAKHPNVAISLSNLALVRHDLGNAVSAKLLLERALAIEEPTLGPDHPSVAIRMSNLAIVLKDLGDVDCAKELLERALSIFQKRFSPDHPWIARVRFNLAAISSTSGRGS